MDSIIGERMSNFKVAEKCDMFISNYSIKSCTLCQNFDFTKAILDENSCGCERMKDLDIEILIKERNKRKDKWFQS